MSKPKQPKLVRVPCDECDGQGWYYLARKHPDGRHIVVECEFCTFGYQWASESEVKKLM